MSNLKLEVGLSSNSSNTPFFTPGTIISTLKKTVPNGWLLCDGSEYSKTGAYASLYAIIGTRYGETNGSGGVGTSHFRVPDLRGGHIATVESGIAATGGSNTHTHTITANATAANVAINHYHAVSQSGYGGANTYHSHSGGDSYVGANGSNPANANKTGTGGSGYGSGGAHVHDGYSYGNTNADNGTSYHSVASLGINAHTAGNHSHTSASTFSTNSGSTTTGTFSIPSVIVNFMVKV